MNIIIAAMGCIVNEKNEILLALRNDPTSPKVHHKWQLPGGGIDPGETVEEAAIRETKEETGLEVSIVSRRPSVAFGVINERKHTKDTRILLIGYKCKVTGGVMGNNISKETAKLQWFPVSSIPWDITLPGNRTIIEEFFKK